ncbi:MAG TPA: DUF4238 domain-containing protein [Nitrososphaera sp.]|nr:DUF4238 domain-containing protein [Nitrososphaera sp.]
MTVKPNSVVAPPAKHHYIPQFYQRGFTAEKDSRIWVYEKGKEPRRYFVRGTGVNHALYGFTNNRNEFDAETIEKELAKIDNDGAKVIQKLERGNTLKDKERLRLCRFVSVMWRRTPKHKEEVNRMAAEMMPNAFEGLDEEWIRRKVEERASSPAAAERLFEREKAEFERLHEKYMKEVPDFLFPSNTIRDSNFEQVMYGMDWVFFKAAPGTEFLTCDDPAFFNKGTGLKDKEAVIMFPLSRKLFFQAMHISDYRNGHHLLSAAGVDTLNTYVVQNAYKQVYASYRSETITTLVNEQIGSLWRV